MSLDRRLREGLARSSSEIHEPGLESALEGIERGARKRRLVRRAIGALAILATLVVAVVVGPRALDALRSSSGGGGIPATTGSVPSRIDLRGYAQGFSGDGTEVFATSEGGGDGYIYDAMTGELLRAVEWKHGDGVATFSPDGTLFATAVGDPNCCDMYVYETVTGRELAHISKACCYGTFSPDGSMIAVPYFPGDHPYSRVVDTRTGASVNEFDHIGNFAFSPDGGRIAVGSDAEGVVARIYDLGGLVTANASLTLHGENTGEALDAELAWSPDGATIVTTILGREATVWDATTGEVRYTIPSPSGRITSVAFGSNPNRIATGSSDGTAIVWDMANGDPRPISTRRMKMGNQDFLSVGLSPDGTRLMTATARYETTIWDISD